MVSVADLRGNPIFQRNQSAQALQDIRTNTAAFLQTNVLTINAGNGHQTVLSPAVPFVKDPNQDSVRIGAAYAGPNAVTASCLVTPTRANQGGGLVNRLAPVQRFVLGAATQLWITDQQTGCTCLILDWGGNQYSSAHILPHLRGDFNAVNQFLFGRSMNVESTIKNHYLRNDMNAIVSATSAALLGAIPQRYIMMQSQFSIGNLRIAQMIGVNTGGQWAFYKQLSRVAGAGRVVDSVNQLEWRPWTDWAYRNNE